ncbi:unnamed protein product [Rotaria socialis]|uniref:Uncharacterized protein n=1 Tax=Rotaria socialis TaxID=392032 RepID=A0A820RUP2_9BILA|nr:unnamed protein product [Rotaria socialis]
MRRGTNDNYLYNKKGSSSSNLKRSNISINEMPKISFDAIGQNFFPKDSPWNSLQNHVEFHGESFGRKLWPIASTLTELWRKQNGVILYGPPVSSAFEASGTYNLEEMNAFIRQNPNAAFGVHEHLTLHTHPRRINAPAQSSTPQAPNRLPEMSFDIYRVPLLLA